MPLNGTTLGDEITAKIQAQNPNLTPEELTKIKAFWEPISEAIVEHIKANALVNVTVASVSGVLTGSGVSGPGTGVGEIT